MDFNSFYGGRKGASFVLVCSYGSVQEMVENFRRGVNYTTVNYDEYVLINTVDKKDPSKINRHDPDNGKIFKRGYDYTNEMGGAEYVGSIVGPGGLAPHMLLSGLDEVKDIIDQQIENGDDNFDYRRGEGEYAINKNLVPGKYTEGGTIKYNDEIKWAYCSIRDNHGEDTTAYIGFEIPYTVTDYEAHSVDAYYNRSNQTNDFTNQNLVDRLDDKQHPFYEKWKISVPKGIKGDAFKNLKVVEASDIVEDYPGKDDDIEKKRKIVVYEYFNYDKKSDGEPKTIYLGDYNKINKVDLNEEGTIAFDFDHDDDKVFNKALKWIKSVELNNKNGRFTVLYNQEADKDGKPTKYETDLAYVSDITLQTNGELTVKYITGDSKPLNTIIQWISSVSFDEGGNVEVVYNTGQRELFEKAIKWVTKSTLAPDGTLKFQYNIGEEEVFDKSIQWIDEISLSKKGAFNVKYNNGTPDYNTTLKWVDDVTLDDKGTMNIIYNTGEKTEYKNLIKIIKDIKIDTGEKEGEGSQKVSVSYNTGAKEEIGNPLNYVMRSVITQDYHLLFLYSDPAKRAEIVSSGKGYLYDGRNDWHDMGSVKSDSGLLIGENLDLDEHKELTNNKEIIEYLNSEYPTGLLEQFKQGKLVTAGSADSNKSFFAFDYTKTGENLQFYKGWYFLGVFGDVSSLADYNDQEGRDRVKQLPVGGLWFVIEGTREG